MRGEATVVAIIFAAFMSLLAPLMLLNPTGILAPGYPEILDARVAPEKIPPGDPLYITAWVKDTSGIESVFVYIENEVGVDRVRMVLASGSLFDGMFEAKWVSHDTLNEKWYNATIIATNTMNLSSYIILPWQDPTQGHSASQVRAGTFSAGNYAFPNNLTAGGTLFVDNSTGRVGIGTTGPSVDLHVYKSGGYSQILIGGTGANDEAKVAIRRGATDMGSYFTWETGTTEKWSLGLNYEYSPNDEFILSSENTDNILVMQQEGNVGINTTDPDTDLHVRGGVCIDDDDSCTDPGAGNLSVAGIISIGWETNSTSISTSGYVDCPNGKKVLGGGCNCSSETIEKNYNSDDDTWYCECTGYAASQSAYVICAYID